MLKVLSLAVTPLCRGDGGRWFGPPLPEQAEVNGDRLAVPRSLVAKYFVKRIVCMSVACMLPDVSCECSSGSCFSLVMPAVVYPLLGQADLFFKHVFACFSTGVCERF